VLKEEESLSKVGLFEFDDKLFLSFGDLNYVII